MGPAGASGAPPRDRVSRRSRLLLAGGIAVALVVAGAVAGLALISRSGSVGSALGAPRFVEETAASGLEHTYSGGDSTYDTGGGVAVFDCDGDRRPDIYMAGGAAQASLFRNESPTGGALRFARVTSPVTDLTDVSGAYPIDVDGDGIVDLVVLRAGGARVLRGLGDCRFAEANATFGLSPKPEMTTAFSATWEGSAALPTLAFGNYVDPNSGGPAGYRCGDNELFRPDASGTRYAAAIPLEPGYCALSMLFSDWDGSGRRDLRVSNDRQYYNNETGGEQLWRVEPGQPPRLYTDADGWVLLQLWGMGIASYDVTGDGYPDVYLTSQAANTLQTLLSGPAQPTYRDIALKRHIEATRPDVGGDALPSTAWHPEFQDVNNDGFMDLFISKGNVNEIPDYAAKDPSNLFLGQPDGMYVEAAQAAGIVTFDRGRGAALADFNLDGLLDLVEVTLDTPVHVWRNVGAGTASAPAQLGGWLALRLAQPGGNRDAIGAWVEVKTGDTVTRREVTVGGGHIGGQLGWLHFGLGPVTDPQVRVTWPDGEVGPWMRVAANQFLDVERGAVEARPWVPAGS